MTMTTKNGTLNKYSSQLTQVRSDIEVLEGQIKYYDEAVALSSISVVLQSLEGVKPLEVGGWQPVGVARNAVQAMIDTMQFIGSVVRYRGGRLSGYAPARL